MARQLKYDQVRLAILNIIAEDHLQPGDRMPSVRQLLTRIPSCSMITLRKALEMLENESMLSRCIGKGTFLKQNVPEKLTPGGAIHLRPSLPLPAVWNFAVTRARSGSMSKCSRT